MQNLIAALNALAVALTGKPIAENTLDSNVEWLLEGQECYLPDGGYSRVVVGWEGNAWLTSNSTQAVKDAWARCATEIANLEQAVREVRGSDF